MEIIIDGEKYICFETKEFFEELDKNGYMWDGKMVVKKEQNKPKFKVDDWIVNNENGKVSQIKKIVYDESGYGYDHTNGWFHFVFEKDYHLWTIDDAKDGDVLAAHECYVIFKEIKGLNIKCHCTCHYMGFNPSFDINTLQNKTAFHPATKEECDRLFQKMKEAGFEWDADTKKLVKTTIPIPKFRVGDIIKHKPTGEISTIKKVCSNFYILEKGTILYFESQDKWELVASKVNLSLEDKVSILTDEILALKERVKALEIQAIKQCSDKNRLDSLESKMIILDSHNINNRLNALESMVFPIPDIYKSSDKAGDNVTLEEMKG